MKNITKTELRKAQTIEDLENLEIDRVYVSISHRGGGVGFPSNSVASAFGVDEEDLPRMFGAYCNYLGGGIRGAIVPSEFNTGNIRGRKAELLEELAKACARVYANAEGEGVDQEDDWDAKATKAARAAGIKSAY